MSYKLHSLSEDDARFVKEGKKLPVMEEFYTIQGEGFNTGKPAYFIRIGGCDVGCHWCDVKESWDANLHALTNTESVVHNLLETGTNAAVVTGGEPLIYNLDFLTSQLKKNNILTFIETSGAYELSGEWDWICLSPKKNAPPLEGNFKFANELKMIVYNQHDFMWAEELASKVSRECHLFLQPEWSKSEKLLPVIIEYVKKNTKWRISLQTHKFMNIP